MNFKASGEDAIIDMKENGLVSFLFCESLRDELLSVWQTLKAYMGGLGLHGKGRIFGPKVPGYVEEANREFLKWGMNYEMTERTIRNMNLDESLINSGDLIAVQRVDGLSSMIMYGTGAHSSHSVVALRHSDGRLYFVESNDAAQWATKRVQRNLYHEWLKEAEWEDLSAVHVPLSAEMRAKFNETAAWEWFATVEGLPYGYHSFLSSWIDTPENNTPPVLP